MFFCKGLGGKRLRKNIQVDCLISGGALILRSGQKIFLFTPFGKGNGRVSRILSTLMALQAGLPLLDFSTMNEQKKIFCGRSLEEDIPLHATHKRLSRHLADPGLGSRIETHILRLGADRISEKTLLIVDPTDLQRKDAKKMQYLARVRDASEDTIGNGHWMCDVVGCEVAYRFHF